MVNMETKREYVYMYMNINIGLRWCKRFSSLKISMNGRMKFNENVYTDRYTYIINIYMTFSTFGKDVAYRTNGDTQ